MLTINSIFFIFILSATMLSVKAAELIKVDCSLTKRLSYLGQSMSNSKEIVALNIDLSKKPVVVSFGEPAILIVFTVA